MRIGIALFKFFHYGGIARDALKIAAEARSRGHDVTFYTLRWEGDEPEDARVVLAPEQGLFNHIRYAHFARWLPRQLEQDRIDVLLGMNKMPGLDVYYAGDSCFEEKARKQRSWFYRMTPRYRHFSAFERAVFGPDASTTVLTISPFQIEAFQHYYGTPADRFVELPPGIDRSRAAEVVPAGTRERYREQLGVGDDDHLLAFVGSGFIRKGLDRVLLALHALPEAFAARVKLAVVGQDRGDAFERMAARLGIDRQVSFLGGRDDVPAWLQAADGLVLPAYDENAGMVIIESMIAGLPVLVTANCGYAHYVDRHDAGIVSSVPFEAKRFTAEIQELLTSPRRGAWQRNGRALANDERIYRLAPCAVDELERHAS